MRSSFLRPAYLLAAMTILTAGSLPAAEPSAATKKVSPQDIQKAVDRAAGFLQTKAQQPDGSYASYAGSGITSIVTAGLLRNGKGVDDPVVAKGLKYLESVVREDGGIYAPKSLYGNYETCLAMMAFHEANRDGRYTKIVERAEAFVKKEQWDEGEGVEKTDVRYGGAGYGKHQRPDLSNTSFFVEALQSIGKGEDDPAIQKALVFVSRCQNLESEHNTTGIAVKNPDGGFYYTPVNGGESMAGKLPDGGLRSYGSMTYAGLKSMIYAGVGPEDERVKAALKWIQKHYGVDTNPGMGDAGLYYYYHTFAKALDTLGKDQVEDANGVKHDWRSELAAELIRRQRDDGSWINENSRWLEGEPALVTGYALLTLAYCRPAEKPAK